MLFSRSLGQPLPTDTFTYALMGGLDGVASGASRLEVAEIVVIARKAMIYLGCSGGATLVMELTYITVPLEDR